MSTPVTIGIVGSAWRAEFFARLARLLPATLTLVGAVVRRAEAAEDVTRRWSVPAYLSPHALVEHQHPDLVVTSVPWAVNPTVVSELVETGTRVLCETPPAPDLEGLRRLWALVGSQERVQVAEQYLLLPPHAARRAVVNRGVIGQATSVQVSSTHGYHAVSIMRGLLAVGFGPATIRAARFVAPLVDPLSRAGWSDDYSPKPASTTITTLDFGDGLSALYDFTDNQWHNRLRLRRILIRGSHGEIADDSVVRLAADRAITRSSLIRSQLGYDLNLEGYDTEHISLDGEVVYRNPFIGLRLMDEEIAIASLLTGAAAWVRDEGPAPYPLAQACQDQHLSLAMEEAAKTGAPIVTTMEDWSSS